MQATRREVLERLLVSVGATTLGACGSPADVATSPGVAYRFYTAPEMALIERISDLLIPRTETPGALDAGVPRFMDGLMATWANSATQAAHRATLGELGAQLDAITGNAFIAAPPARAEAVLSALDAQAYAEKPTQPSALLGGYLELKTTLTQAYFVSESGATEELDWRLIPGRWDPCVPLSPASQEVKA